MRLNRLAGQVLAAALVCLPVAAAVPAAGVPAALRTQDAPSTLEVDAAVTVAGSTKAEKAPEIEQGRTHDSFVSRSDSFDRYYRYRMDDPAGNLRVSVHSKNTDARLYVSLGPVEGYGSCGSQSTSVAFEPMPSIRTTVVERAEECAESGEVVIRVNGYSKGPQDFELWVVDEPEVTDQGWSVVNGKPKGKPATGGEATEVEPGSGPDSLPVVGTGAWTATVGPGEVHWFAVPLAYGQGLKARFVVDEFPEDAGLTFVSADVLDPMLTSVTEATLGSGTGYAKETLELPVVPLSAARRSDGPDWASLPGYHRIALAVDEFDGPRVPYRLEIEVVGEPQQGPQHAEGDPWSYDAEMGAVPEGTVFGEEADAPSGGSEEPDAGSDETRADADAAGEGMTTRKVAGGALGLLGVGAMVAGVVLQTRRSRTA